MNVPIFIFISYFVCIQLSLMVYERDCTKISCPNLSCRRRNFFERFETLHSTTDADGICQKHKPVF